MGLAFPPGQAVYSCSALSHALLAIALGAFVAVWGYLEFRRPRLVSRQYSTSTPRRPRLDGFGLDARRASGLLAMLVGTGIAFFGLVPTDVDVVLAVAFCAVSVLVVLWYGALTA